MILEEESIINRLKNGDTDTLSYLMDIYCNNLKRSAYLIIKDEKLAEDAVQDTFINFYYNIHNFKGESQIKTYLYKILLNECRQIMRKNWFKKVISFENWNIKDDNTYNIDDNEVDKLTLSSCISNLNPKDKEVILLYYYEDMSLENICKITNEKEGTIKSRLKRSRDKLKPFLKEAGFNE